MLCEQTLGGIDTCAERLAAEVREYVAAHSDLQRITILAHSMGGLVARYMIGGSGRLPVSGGVLAAVLKNLGSLAVRKAQLQCSITGHSQSRTVPCGSAGRLYDRHTGLVAGLEPAHFFAMATPHMGCGGYGIIQACNPAW